MNILFLDIETSPNLVHVWQLFKQTVSINQILDSTEVLCWAAKWYDEDKIMFGSQYKDSKKGMARAIWDLLDKADAVVHYNGQAFDIPHLNREFLELGLTPPSSFKQIDLFRTIKSQFNFPSNKLDYVVQALNIGQKVKHTGHELWIRCLNWEKEAWELMQEYNEEDVRLTEALYTRILPWIKGHPNTALYLGTDIGDFMCPRCGSEDTIKQGYAYTPTSKFQQYQCKECGGWFRGRKNLADRTQLASPV